MKLGERAPAFSLPGVDGRTHALESLKGEKATIVVFSCNHCPYVVKAEPALISAARDYAPKGVSMAAINANDAGKYPEDSFDAMVVRAKERGFPFPYLHDESQAVARAYGAVRTPHLFVLDAELKLAYEGDVESLRDALDDLVAGKPVRKPQTHALGCTIKWK